MPTVVEIHGRVYYPGEDHTLLRWVLLLSCGHQVTTQPAPAPPPLGRQLSCKQCKERT